MLDSAQVSERVRKGERGGGQDRFRRSRESSPTWTGERASAWCVQTDLCPTSPSPSPPAAHLTHLISALGEDGGMFGDDLHALGMSKLEINLPRDRIFTRLGTELSMLTQPKLLLKLIFHFPPLPPPSARRSPSRAFFSFSLSLPSERGAQKMRLKERRESFHCRC